MELLHALGINQYAVVQFFVFCFMFIFLTLYVLVPFQQALEERQERTKGSEVLAEEYQQKTVELNSKYQDKAREINGHIHEIFASKRALAQVEHDRIVGQAREASLGRVEENRKSLGVILERVQKELAEQTPGLALSIVNKLLGKKSEQ
jgi:F0F1-type ATP synthase membrane subunit b/b'